jgi:hypothetical protein
MNDYQQFAAIRKQFGINVTAERRFSPAAVHPFVDAGLMYMVDEDQTNLPYYGLTAAGVAVRGQRQMDDAKQAHRAEMERRRQVLAAFETGERVRN